MICIEWPSGDWYEATGISRPLVAILTVYARITHGLIKEMRGERDAS